MAISKELARQLGVFHLIPPDELINFKEHAEWLEAILHGHCSVFQESNGDLILLETRQLVERIKGVKIEIYSKEHPPPHFHVKSPTINASFCINSCQKLKGRISNSDYLKIKYWHKHSKNKLINVWNDTRPSGCTVGIYMSE